MHPAKLDDLSRSLGELLDADIQWCTAQAYEARLPVRLEHLVIRSRKRIRQLYYELAPAMTDEYRQTWKAAASLGRTHRPKLLEAGRQTRLLTAGTAETPAELNEPSIEVTSAIGRLAHRVRLRIGGGEAQGAAAE
jgi:hypothetical protein